LQHAHLEGANLMFADLEGAYLSEAFLDSATGLILISIGKTVDTSIAVADVRWGGANLGVVHWSKVKRLLEPVVDFGARLGTLRGRLGMEGPRFAPRVRRDGSWRETIVGATAQRPAKQWRQRAKTFRGVHNRL